MKLHANTIMFAVVGSGVAAGIGVLSKDIGLVILGSTVILFAGLYGIAAAIKEGK